MERRSLPTDILDLIVSFAVISTRRLFRCTCKRFHSSIPNDIDQWLTHSLTCNPLQSLVRTELCKIVKRILKREPNVIFLKSPITICGNVHGQFFDVLELFKIGGDLPETQYLFLGDYVNRGLHGLELIEWLLILKVKYPDRITLLRGNHDTRAVTQVYGLYDEIFRKLGSTTAWDELMDVFQCLPIAAVVDDKIFCVHGGLAPDINTIDDITTIDRFKDHDPDDHITNLLWADPNEEEPDCEWTLSPRGAGYLFGRPVVDAFLSRNNLTSIVRSHQLCMEGHRTCLSGLVTTVWSAPNYCYRCGNIASVLEVDREKWQFKVFIASDKSVIMGNDLQYRF